MTALRISPHASRRSISRASGSTCGSMSRSMPMRVSVAYGCPLRPIALTTTTGENPCSRAETTRMAEASRASGVATLVPPNFITLRRKDDPHQLVLDSVPELRGVSRVDHHEHSVVHIAYMVDRNSARDGL